MRTSKPGRVTRTIAPLIWALCMLMPAVLAQQTQPTPVPQADTCTVDPDGTAHITRVVPVPGTISPEAQKFISRPGPSGPEPALAERRARTDRFRTGRAAEARKIYPVKIEDLRDRRPEPAGRFRGVVHGSGIRRPAPAAIQRTA